MAFKWQPIKIYTKKKYKLALQIIIFCIMLYFLKDLYFALVDGYTVDRFGDLLTFKLNPIRYTLNLAVDLVFGFVAFYYVFYGIKTGPKMD
jgi:hypothetical protein